MEHTTPPTTPQGLVELLRQQRDLYRQLQSLSQRQRALISGDRPELLLNILQDRQALISSLAKVNEQLSPYRRDWQNIYQSLPDGLRATVSQLLEEINGMLRLILRADQEDQALLSARKQVVAESLGTVSGGQAANSAYAGRPTGGGAAADLTG